MKYSAQEQKFIKLNLFAQSYYKKNDDRTYNSYYIDENNLIHSSSLNYSLVSSTPLTVEEFKNKVEKDDYKVNYL